MTLPEKVRPRAVVRIMAELQRDLPELEVKLLCQDRRDIVRQRYSSWDSGVGAEIEADKYDFASLEAYMLKKGDADKNVSGRQEMIENVVNRYLR